MTSGRPGPAHIQISTNMMGAPCPELAPPNASGNATPLPLSRLRSVAAALNNADKVVILAGGGVRGAEGALQKLAESLDAPVVLTTNARGAMHKHRLVVPASPSLNAVRALIAEADQVLAIGTELGPTDYDAYAKGGFPDLSGMIRIDICADQLARHPAAMPIKADALTMLTALLPMTLPVNREGGFRAEATRTAARADRLWRTWLWPGCGSRCRNRRPGCAGHLPDRRRRLAVQPRRIAHRCRRKAADHLHRLEQCGLPRDCRFHARRKDSGPWLRPVAPAHGAFRHGL